MLPGGAIKFSLQQPFEVSLQLVFACLRSRGMRVAGQLDVSRRLAGALGIALEPCKLIFVLPDPAALTVGTIHPSAALLLPLHVVISNNDSQTEIRIPNAVQETGPGGTRSYRPVVEAQRQLIEAIETVAVRPSALA